MAQSCGRRTGSQAASLKSIASAPACAPLANFQSRLKFSTRRGDESAENATVIVTNTSKAARRKIRLFMLLGDECASREGVGQVSQNEGRQRAPGARQSEASPEF